MARFENPQLTAAERLRIIVSREKGGYTVGRRKWAKVLGVSERSVERYLQRSGANKRNIRSREAQAKINRAFTARVRKDPRFLATMILREHEQFDLTPYMVDSIGDNVQPIMYYWEREGTNRDPRSVWNNRKPLPRIYIEGGQRTGLAYSRFAINVFNMTGELLAEGEETNVSAPANGNTFGYVDDKALAIRGRPNDIAEQVNQMIGLRLSGKKIDKQTQQVQQEDASVVIVLAAFTPAGAERVMPPLPWGQPETFLKHRKGKAIKVFDERKQREKVVKFEWKMRKRGRKR